MSWTRREFLKNSVCSTAVLGMATALPACNVQRRNSSRKLKLLILGGSAFLGPATVEAALARGHEMTLFNRGQTNPYLFPDLEKLRGDRDGDLAALQGRTWDAVIDTSGYLPRLVDMSAELLANAVGQYVFISTISVYRDYSIVGMDETAPVSKLEDDRMEEITSTTYGPLKALCEQAAERNLPGRTTVIRPGLIVGPRDRSDRFTYWLVRVAHGGEVLAPGSGQDFIQFIDVRDLGEWIVTCIEDEVVGVYNTDGPPATVTMAGMLNECKTVTGSDATFTWIDPAFLEEQGVQAWSDMPCWVPAEGEYAGFGQVSSAKALGKGLHYRPLVVTIRDTLAWWNEQPEERRAELRAGISPKREQEVLTAWHARR